MRFPDWALSDDRMKVKYLMRVAALEVSPSGDLQRLCRHCCVSYSTLLWAIDNTVSPKVAEMICDGVKNSGIKPHWLTHPGWIVIDPETGEITE